MIFDFLFKKKLRQASPRSLKEEFDLIVLELNNPCIDYICSNVLTLNNAMEIKKMLETFSHLPTMTIELRATIHNYSTLYHLLIKKTKI